MPIPEYKCKELAETMKLAYAYVQCCLRCRTCGYYYTPEEMHFEACPSLWKYHFAAYAGGGKLTLLRLIHEGVLEWNQELADILYRCTTCGNCRENCYSLAFRTPSFNYVRLIELMRAEIVQRGFMLPEHQVLINSIKNYDNPWQGPRSRKDRWAKKLIVKDLSKEKAEVLYYVGCTAAYDTSINRTAVATVQVLKKAGVDFGILGTKEICCGSVALRIGDRDLVRNLAIRNIEMFNNLGVSTIVTACAGCYKTIYEDYREFGKVKPEILHITQYLDRLIQEGKVNLKEVEKIKVTYHDPCHLGRHAKVFEEPRNILKAISGIDFLEMPRSRKASWCCGAGGGVRSGYPDWSSETAVKRVEEAEGTGADYLVSGCPFCFQNLENAIRATNSGLKMLDVVELMEQAMV